MKIYLSRVIIFQPMLIVYEANRVLARPLRIPISIFVYLCLQLRHEHEKPLTKKSSRLTELHRIHNYFLLICRSFFFQFCVSCMAYTVCLLISSWWLCIGLLGKWSFKGISTRNYEAEKSQLEIFNYRALTNVFTPRGWKYLSRELFVRQLN